MRAALMTIVLGYTEDGIRAGLLRQHLLRSPFLFRRGPSVLRCVVGVAWRLNVGIFILARTTTSLLIA